MFKNTDGFYKNKYLMSLTVYDYINDALDVTVPMKTLQSPVEDGVVVCLNDLSDWDLLCYHNQCSPNHIDDIPVIMSSQLNDYFNNHNEDDFYDSTFDAGLLIFKIVG